MYTMNAVDFNENFMKGLFRKIYPVIAKQIVERTGISEGHCIDLGGGPGMLGISLAHLVPLNVTVLDLMPECVALALQNIWDHGVSKRVTAMQGVAEAMPFADNSIDLVASRGSVFFWEDQQQGLSEVYRVLRPGGWAYIGGGFGTLKLQQEIEALKADDPQWLAHREERLAKNPPGHFMTILERLGIDGSVEQSEAGSWIIFQKSTTTNR